MEAFSSTRAEKEPNSLPTAFSAPSPFQAISLAGLLGTGRPPSLHSEQLGQPLVHEYPWPRNDHDMQTQLKV